MAAFVGDLFAEGLIKGSFVQLCMNLILDKLSVLEEVCALHAIVFHAGEMLYERVPLYDMVRTLQMRCASGSITSVVGNADAAQEAEHLVQVRISPALYLFASLTYPRQSPHWSTHGRRHAPRRLPQNSPSRPRSILTTILNTLFIGQRHQRRRPSS